MKVSILYHPESDHARAVTDFVRDYKHVTNKDVELISLETPDGAHLAKLYDVTNYPAVLAVSDDGHLLKVWQDEVLPLINEVSYYAQGEEDAGTRL
jgi:hypothetical protein